MADLAVDLDKALVGISRDDHGHALAPAAVLRQRVPPNADIIGAAGMGEGWRRVSV